MQLTLNRDEMDAALVAYVVTRQAGDVTIEKIVIHSNATATVTVAEVADDLLEMSDVEDQRRQPESWRERRNYLEEQKEGNSDEN